MNQLSAGEVRAIEIWNHRFGDSIPLSQGLLSATFLKNPPSKREAVEVGSSFALCHADGDQIRIDAAAAPSSQELASSLTLFFEKMEVLANCWNCKTIVWGGGANHVFPGIPVENDLSVWLKYFEKSGPEVMDFGGELKKLKSIAVSTQAKGVLRSPTNAAEEARLINFVEKEFPGRWARDLTLDARNRLIKHYFTYLIDHEIVGYARLYGWSKDYWAPGVYFALPAHQVGGLGPIGVASHLRGHGLGASILKLSWDVLLGHGLSSVRIDWTTERHFYEKWGLELVQRYQPARLPYGSIPGHGGHAQP